MFILFYITDIYINNLLKPLRKRHARFTGDVIWNLVRFLFKFFILEIPNYGEVIKTLHSPTHSRCNNQKRLQVWKTWRQFYFRDEKMHMICKSFLRCFSSMGKRRIITVEVTTVVFLNVFGSKIVQKGYINHIRFLKYTNSATN